MQHQPVVPVVYRNYLFDALRRVRVADNSYIYPDRSFLVHRSFAKRFSKSGRFEFI